MPSYSLYISDGHFNIRIFKHTYSHTDSKIFANYSNPKMKFVLQIHQIIFAGQHFLAFLDRIVQ